MPLRLVDVVYRADGRIRRTVWSGQVDVDERGVEFRSTPERLTATAAEVRRRGREMRARNELARWRKARARGLAPRLSPRAAALLLKDSA
jgi:hypothetical protein